MADVTIGNISVTAVKSDPTGQKLEIEEGGVSKQIQADKFLQQADGLVPGVSFIYANIAARDLDAANVLDRSVIEVTDAVADPENTIPSGVTVWYRKVGASAWKLISRSDGGTGSGGGAQINQYYVSPDLDNVIVFKDKTPIQLTQVFYNGVTTATFRSKLDGVDPYVVRASLAALNTYLDGLADGIKVDIEITTNPTELTIYELSIDRT